MAEHKRACSLFPCRTPAAPGCNGRCERHAVKTDRGERAIYGAGHIRRRIEAFIRDDWTCLRCGWKPPFLVEHDDCVRRFGIDPMPVKIILKGLTRFYHARTTWLEADHILSAVARPDLAEELSNLGTLCNHCHYLKNNEADGRNR
jgi:hypothetical protein